MKMAEGQFIEECEKLFEAIRGFPVTTSKLYQAMLYSIKSSANERSYSKVVESLYRRDSDFSEILKVEYAFTNLYRVKGKEEEFVGISEAFISQKTTPGAIIKNPNTFNMLGFYYGVYLEQKDYNRAAELFEKAYALKKDLLTLRYMATALHYSGNKKRAKKFYTEILQNSDEELEKATIKREKIESELLQIYQDFGQFKEASEILFKWTDRKLKKRQKKGALIKSAVELEKTISKEQKELAEKHLVEKKPKKKERQPQSSSSIVENAIEADLDPSGVAKPRKLSKKAAEKQEKTKEKTRGTPDLQEGEEGDFEEIANVRSTSVTIEQLLQEQKKIAYGKVYKIFYKFFESVKGQISDKKITITLEEVESLMGALGQDFDPSKGKGSHRKVTMNFQNKEIYEDEEMVILPNRSNLKPYLIKSLRERFIFLGLYPADLRETLQEKMLL